MIIPIISIALIIGCCAFSGGINTKNPTDHFNGEKFYNPDKDREHSFWDFLKWSMNRDKGLWYEWIDEKPGPKPPERVANGELRITFVNHSTVLIQTDSLNILTDPVWSERVSPLPFIGPKRHRAPGIRFKDLPPIDIVLVSHDHYDHCDLSTLKKLKQTFNPLFIFSLGNKKLLTDQGLTNTNEMDWWQEKYINANLKITCVPARHFSMRGFEGRNKTLWCGYVIETEGGPVYFAGDTGFGRHFKQIREKFGSFRFSMLPIGAYRPRWFMEQMHTSPHDAVLAHKILESQKTIGIHFGTFNMADDGQFEPIEDLKKALKEENVSEEDFFAPVHGKGYDIPQLKKEVSKK